MPRSYTKMEEIAAAVFARKAAGETNKQIGESYGLTRRQIEQLVNRQNRKRRKLELLFVPKDVRERTSSHQKRLNRSTHFCAL